MTETTTFEWLDKLRPHNPTYKEAQDFDRLISIVRAALAHKDHALDCRDICHRERNREQGLQWSRVADACNAILRGEGPVKP